MCQKNGPNPSRTREAGFVDIDYNTHVVDLWGQHKCH